MSLMLAGLNMSGQQNDSLFQAEAGFDAVSAYVWRGMRLSPSPAIQPSLSVSAGNFTLGAWSSWMLNDTWSEFDLSASYENAFLYLGITDYFIDDHQYASDYFNYEKGLSNHVIEVSVGFPGNEKLPFSVMISTNIWGDIDTSNHENYSTFAEFSWFFECGKFDSELRAGLTPSSGMYAGEFAMVEAAWRLERTINLPQDVQLKLLSEITLNPTLRGVYLVAGAGFVF